MFTCMLLFVFVYIHLRTYEKYGMLRICMYARMHAPMYVCMQLHACWYVCA